MADSISAQIERIMEGMHPGRWSRSPFSTHANIDGLGFVIADVMGDAPNLRFGVYLATDVPFSPKLVSTIQNLNTQVMFGAMSILIGDSTESVGLMLYYDFMKPWFSEMSLNNLGVFQPLLDIIGNLPVIATQLSDRVIAEHGGKKPDLSDGWDAVAIFLL